MRPTQRTTRVWGAVVAVAAMSLLLSACLGSSIPKCDDPEVIQGINDLYASAYKGTYTENFIKDVRLDRVRTPIELFYQSDPEIRGCRATINFSFIYPQHGWPSWVPIPAVRQLGADGRMYATETAEYTIEWEDKRAHTLWLQFQTTP